MICRIEVEGLDRTGKDTLVGYLDYMSGRLMPVGSRGLLSTLAYADIFGRDIPIEKIHKLCEGNKETLVVFLTADEDDLKIRHKMSHHEPIDFETHKNAFYKWMEFIENYGITVLTYCTSRMTPYQIAKDIIFHIEQVEEWER